MGLWLHTRQHLGERHQSADASMVLFRACLSPKLLPLDLKKPIGDPRRSSGQEDQGTAQAMLWGGFSAGLR